MRVTIIEPEEALPALPAAVEANAYRITLEALTNAVRHSQAQQFTIRFRCEVGSDASSNLVIQMTDDGIGIPVDYKAGVGLRSMRERAEELGGKLAVERLESHGTQITCWLPITTALVDRM